MAGGYREKALSGWDGRCERCGDDLTAEEAEVHHVDRDRSNERDDNLEVLCRPCHYHEHHGDDPLWGLVVSLPRPLLGAVDHAVEERGYDSRSEAVARAIAQAYEPAPDSAGMHDLHSSTHAWFHRQSPMVGVNERTIPPDPDGGGECRPRVQNDR